MPVGKNIAALKKRAKAAGIPCIYVNDNFGRWQSDFKKIVAHCRDEAKEKSSSKCSCRTTTITSS